jgi:hypothetical protein
MKNFIKSSLILCLLIIVNSCSKDADLPNEDSQNRNNEVINYLNIPNTEGQLLSEVYIEEDKGTTFFYGSTDANGEGLLTQSLAYKVDNSDRIEYVVLDELQRVKYTYSEVNGIKENEIHSFTYPEDGIINYIILKRDWTTLDDEILHFSTIETDGEEFIANNLYGKGSKMKSPPEDAAVLANVGVAVTVLAVVGSLLYAKAPGLARILAALAYTAAAIADEPPVVNNNPNAPTSPETNIIDNQCANSNLSVIIGVDPGNELYAIVNGDSTFYDFYWSTGEEDTDIITSHITAPDDGVYYVMVRDEKGCIAFASTSANENLLEIYKEAAIGNWTTTWHMDTNGDGLLNDDDKTQIDTVVFYEDGTGNRVSTIDYSGNFTDHKDKWGSDPYYDIRWNITKTTDGYSLSYSDLRWGVTNGGKINGYPNMECILFKFGNTEHTITVKD